MLAEPGTTTPIIIVRRANERKNRSYYTRLDYTFHRSARQWSQFEIDLFCVRRTQTSGSFRSSPRGGGGEKTAGFRRLGCKTTRTLSARRACKRFENRRHVRNPKTSAHTTPPQVCRARLPLRKPDIERIVPAHNLFPLSLRAHFTTPRRISRRVRGTHSDKQRFDVVSVLINVFQCTHFIVTVVTVGIIAVVVIVTAFSPRHRRVVTRPAAEYVGNFRRRGRT